MDDNDYEKTRNVLDRASIKHYIKRTPDGLFLVINHTAMVDHHITDILNEHGWRLNRCTENGLEYKHHG